MGRMGQQIGRTGGESVGERGQVMVIGALFMVVLLGMVGLSVDVGYAYVQRRHMENSATSAAEAGTSVLRQWTTINASTTNTATPPTDSEVKRAIDNTLAANGAGPWWWDYDDATHAQDATKQAQGWSVIRARYVLQDSGGATTMDWNQLVGNGGTAPYTTVNGTRVYANGVQIDSTSTHVPAFFARVLGSGGTDVRSGTTLSKASGAVPIPLVIQPPTATSCAGVGCSATATPTATSCAGAGCLPTATPTATVCVGAGCLPTATPTPTTCVGAGCMVTPTNTPVASTPTTMSITPTPTNTPVASTPTNTSITPTPTNTPVAFTPTPTLGTPVPTPTSVVVCHAVAPSGFNGGDWLLNDQAAVGSPIVASVTFHYSGDNGAHYSTAILSVVNRTTNALLATASATAVAHNAPQTTLTTPFYTWPGPRSLTFTVRVDTTTDSQSGATVIDQLTVAYWSNSSTCGGVATPIAVVTPVPSATPSATTIPTITPTASRTTTPGPTATMTPTPGSTATSLPSNVPSLTPTATATATTTATSTSTPTMAPSATGTSTSLPTNTSTPPATATPVATSVYPAGIYIPWSIWGGNPSGARIGGDYTFWSHSWDAQVAGGNYDSNARFKGFIDQPPVGLPPIGSIVSDPSVFGVALGPSQGACSPSIPINPATTQCWSTGPGNSNHANEPANFQSPPVNWQPGTDLYLDVLVTTYVQKGSASGNANTDYGNVAAIVKVRVDDPASYANDPGHPGSSRIVEVLWQSGCIVHGTSACP